MDLLKEENLLKVMKVAKMFFANFKQKVAGIKCYENWKIKMLRTAEKEEKFV